MSNIFEQASTQTPTSASQEGDALTTKLMSITNENGEAKYANLEVALDALKNSQEYIPTLKSELSAKDQELATLRQEIARQQGVQEALERFSQPQPSYAQPEQQVAPQQPETVEQVDIDSLVQAAFSSYQANTKAEANLMEVNNVLTSQYGDKAVEHLASRASELNTTPEAIQEMAKTNPTMALTLLGVQKQSTPSFGGTNTSAWPAPKVEKLQAPKKSLLAGAKESEVQDFMAAIRAEIYNEHGITG